MATNTTLALNAQQVIMPTYGVSGVGNSLTTTPISVEIAKVVELRVLSTLINQAYNLGQDLNVLRADELNSLIAPGSL